jgi:hypothetical protein
MQKKLIAGLSLAALAVLVAGAAWSGSATSRLNGDSFAVTERSDCCATNEVCCDFGEKCCSAALRSEAAAKKDCCPAGDCCPDEACCLATAGTSQVKTNPICPPCPFCP